MPPKAKTIETQAHIRVTFDDPLPRKFESAKTFRIGRSPSCELSVANEFVSRIHAEVVPTPTGWEIHDLNSANGVYLHGAREQTIKLNNRQEIRFGTEGPTLVFEPFQPEPRPPSNNGGDETVLARYADRYFGEATDDQPVGEHTMFIRRAFAKVQTAQKQTHTRRTATLGTAIVMLSLLVIGISLYAWRLHLQTQKNQAIARDMFFAIKSLDIEIAKAEQDAFNVNQEYGIQRVSQFESERRSLQEKYDSFLLQTLHFDRSSGTEEHRLILRVARIFGESEIDMPPEFEKEVDNYIRKWQSSGRFARDVRFAQDKGYARSISKALLEHGLPIQFFYLAMQESDFNPYATGPITRKGYAKGMWQFIPETAVKYGLHLGPLVDAGRPDPADERDQVDKATDAATRYLNMLYSTDAQASGLLVMSCYNWGEDYVLPLVRSLPENPRDRNFWRLLIDYRNQIPQQTYDYVFMITSAAVIGENPRLFGFNLDDPLSEAFDLPVTATR
jgi:hypothetical protein